MRSTLAARRGTSTSGCRRCIGPFSYSSRMRRACSLAIGVGVRLTKPFWNQTNLDNAGTWDLIVSTSTECSSRIKPSA